MKKWIILGTSALITCALVLAQQAEGFYTDEQAKSGEALYQANCAGCHGGKLEGGLAPALNAATLYTDWGTGDALYDMFSKVMPPQSPGTLGEKNYVEILAFILKSSGFAAGKTPLDAKPETLKKIKFEKPKS